MPEPDYLSDLNLDQVWAALSGRREQFALDGFFYERLRTTEAVEYRHEVLRDLEGAEVSAPVYEFAEGMSRVRKELELVGKLRDTHQLERWFLAAVHTYCDTVAALGRALEPLTLRSRGLLGLRGYLHRYVESQAFGGLIEETIGLERELSEVTYTTMLKGLRVTVKPYEDEADLAEQVAATFAKFRQGAVKDYRVSFRSFIENNPVEQQVLALVAEINPDLFARVAAYVARRRRGFVDATVARFEREVQFYLGYLEYIQPLKALGLSFCYPVVSEDSKRTRAIGTFDLALAHKLAQTETAVVCNDIELRDQERLIVVTGPNQGGKTTFARMFGQLHYLASLGLPVPGRSARLFLPDRIFTHFEKKRTCRICGASSKMSSSGFTTSCGTPPAAASSS